MAERSDLQTRTLVFELEARADDNAIPVVVSTDAVVEVADGPEILLHTPEAVDLQRAPLPIIATHRQGQINIGVVDAIRVADGKMRGVARFGVRDEAVGYRNDVLNGTLRSVSVGYRRIKGTVRKDGVLVTTRWMPTHTAMVAEPADVGAGFFRADITREPPEATTAVHIGADADKGQVAAVLRHALAQILQPAAPAATTERKPIMADTQAAAGAVADDPKQGAQQQQTQQDAQHPAAQARQGPTGADLERERQIAVRNLCVAGPIPEATERLWLTSGMSWEAITKDYMDIMAQRSAANERRSPAAIGLTEAETNSFSLFRAIHAIIEKDWSKAGFEAEASRAVAQKLGKVSDAHKFYVPFEVQARNISVPMRRDLTVASSSAGGYLVNTQNMSFIELMRNRSVLYRMGARRLSGLVGSVTVPKQTAAGTAVWLANEASTITESAQTFGQMALSPKSVGGYTEISRHLALQSSPDAEGIVSSDLATVCALAIDVAGLRGAGSGGEPQGVVGTAGVGSVTGTSLAAAGVLEFQSDVASGNLLSESFGYVTTPAVAALLMARPELPSTGTTRLWQGSMLEGSLFGQRAMSSNQMSSATMLAGDFQQVVIGEWGVMEIEVNPYANFQAGIIGVRAIVTIDVGVRYGGAFSYATTIT